MAKVDTGENGDGHGWVGELSEGLSVRQRLQHNRSDWEYVKMLGNRGRMNGISSGSCKQGWLPWYFLCCPLDARTCELWGADLSIFEGNFAWASCIMRHFNPYFLVVYLQKKKKNYIIIIYHPWIKMAANDGKSQRKYERERGRGPKKTSNKSKVFPLVFKAAAFFWRCTLRIHFSTHT